MIFQNMDFHNVAEMRQEENGYVMYRFPLSVAEKMEAGADNVSRYSTGIEIRFKLNSEEAVVYLRAEPAEEAQVAYIYFGSFQGSWYCSSKVILKETTRIRVTRPKNMAVLKRISVEEKRR